NWGVVGYVGGHSAGDHSAAVINNYFIKGPSSSEHFVGEFKPTDHIYQAGNYVDLDRDGTLNGHVAAPEEFGKGEDAPTLIPASDIKPEIPVKLDSAADAYKKIVAGAGRSEERRVGKGCRCRWVRCEE